MAKTSVFRWKGVVPMLLLAAIIGVLWFLYVDAAIRKSVEVVGAEVIGARVDLVRAELHEGEARVVLSGLQVANPDAPMTNLVEVPEIVADLNVRALAEKKVVVESLILRGVRFGTARRTSGALENPGPHSGRVTRQITAWAGSIPTPELNLEGLVGTVVNVDAIAVDSLRSPRQARALVGASDSARAAVEAELRRLDPRPLADSARTLLARLQAAPSARLNPVQAAQLAAEGRSMVARVTTARGQVAALHQNAAAGFRSLQGSASALEAARQADYAWARNLVRLPSIAAPDISMAIFGDMAKARAASLLRYLHTAEQFVPPGLNPRRLRGPERARAAGTTFSFPREQEFPAFLLERAAADLAIGGASVAAGSYSAVITGVTSEPALYGRPMTVRASRRAGEGLRELDVAGVIDRLGREPRDSIRALIGGVSIASITIPKANATLEFAGGSTMEIVLARTGDQLSGTWRMVADTVRWVRRGDSAAAGAARIGNREWAEGLLWRSLAGIPRVELTIRLSGSLGSPGLMLSSNVGEVVAANLRQMLGQEIQRAERAVRERVDQRVGEQVARARVAFAGLEQQYTQVAGQVQALEQLKGEIEEQVRRQAGGLRLPTLPGLPRPE